MPRLCKSERLSLWLERLTRFYNSGQSVAEFCLSENISQPATRIRLPQDVVIELGTEQTTAKAVVDQILLRCLEANSNKAPSC